MSATPSLPELLADTALRLALEAGDLSGWRTSLQRLGELVLEAEKAANGMVNHSGLGRALEAVCLADFGAGLSASQKTFVNALAENDRLELLPEIARIFGSLADLHLPDIEPVRHDGSAEHDTGAANNPFGYEVIDFDTPAAKPPEAIEIRSNLEEIGHLTKKVCGIWGTPELDLFLNHLIMDSRGGDRKGLPPDTAAEMAFLLGINKGVRAIDLSEKTGISYDAAMAHIDAADEARFGSDVWSAAPSRDTFARETRNAGSSVAEEVRTETRVGQFAAAIQLLTMLVTNKWVIGALVILLTAKLVWR